MVSGEKALVNAGGLSIANTVGGINKSEKRNIASW
jgi:hypothetical protein